MTRASIGHVISILGAAMAYGATQPGAPGWLAPVGLAVATLGGVIAGHAAVTAAKGSAS